MIANITTSASAIAIVKYNDNKLKEDNSLGKNAAFLGTNMIANTNCDYIVKSLEARNSLNSVVKKPNIHISLNFHKDDVLDNESIFEIAKDYMDQMGYNDQPYAIYRHFDKEHPHVHIVSTQIDCEGKKINDSHQFRKSQRITRFLEKKYKITEALNQKRKFEDKIPLSKMINEYQEQNKHSLHMVFNRAVSDALEDKPTSEKEFEYFLSKNNIKRKIEINPLENKPFGHTFYLFKVEDFEDNKIYDKGITGSKIDPLYNYDSIMVQIKNNKLIKENNSKIMMGKFYGTLKNMPEGKIPLTAFSRELEKKGIALYTKRKQTGEDINGIYGLNFKDIKTGISYSATDLKIKTKNFLENIIDNEKLEGKAIGEELVKNENFTLNKNYFSDDMVTDYSIGGLSDIFQNIFNTAAAHTKEEEINLAKKKKRRRRRGNN